MTDPVDFGVNRNPDALCTRCKAPLGLGVTCCWGCGSPYFDQAGYEARRKAEAPTTPRQKLLWALREVHSRMDQRKREMTPYATSTSGGAEYAWAKGVARGLGKVTQGFQEAFPEESSDAGTFARFFEEQRMSEDAIGADSARSLTDFCRRMSAWARDSCVGEPKLDL